MVQIVGIIIGLLEILSEFDRFCFKAQNNIKHNVN